MPSSYTSLLKFAKPGLGDTGWGTTVNGGFTDMTEQALTGYVQKAVTVAGPNTIPTIADGASSDGRNQFIELTGTLASPATLTVPAGTLVGSAGNNKLYFIKNSAGDAVTITTGGANTVVVPNGKSMMLRATSAGVEEAMTHLSGTPTAPTAAYGTNTTQLATTAFVQAALQALHPVGSIYINATNSTNPATLLGFGTWVAFGAGRVPVGFDSGNPLFDTAEETGGSADAIVVSHTHTFSATTGTESADHTHSGTTGTESANHTHGTGTGGSFLTGSASTGTTGWNGGGNYTPVQPTANTATQSANHTHTFTTGGVSANHTHSVSGTTAASGSSGTNANYQPYITVYMWKRTA